MAKYTIETNGTTADSIDGNLGVTIEVCGRKIWVQTHLSLTPYTEHDTESICKEAYEQGYKDGYNEPGKNQQEAYQRGLADAWDAAKKIASDNAGWKYSIFGQHFTVEILNTHSASEAIEKIRQYEQEKEEEIQVGDEVKSIERGWTAVVVRISNDDSLILMDSNGAIADAYNKTMFVKTGRHFSEIAEVLTKMRGK